MSSFSESEEGKRFLEDWPSDQEAMRRAFVNLVNTADRAAETSWTFVARPGISYSVRIQTRRPRPERERPLVCLIDVIAEEGAPRWLSVCFYGDEITDPEERGDEIPGGLLGETGYCFDLDEPEEEAVSYLKERIREACVAASVSD